MGAGDRNRRPLHRAERSQGMIRTLRRTWNRLLGSLCRAEIRTAISPRNSIPISSCSPKKTSAAVSRRKRRIAGPDSSSAASSQPRKATAISAVCRLSIPSSRISAMRFAGSARIPVSPPSRSFRSPSASAPTPPSSRWSTPCSSSRSPTRTRSVCSRFARSPRYPGQVPARQPGARSRMGKAVPVARAGRIDARRPAPSRRRRGAGVGPRRSTFPTISSRFSAWNRSWAALFLRKRSRKATTAS